MNINIESREIKGKWQWEWHFSPPPFAYANIHFKVLAETTRDLKKRIKECTPIYWNGEEFLPLQITFCLFHPFAYANAERYFAWVWRCSEEEFIAELFKIKAILEKHGLKKAIKYTHKVSTRLPWWM